MLIGSCWEINLRKSQLRLVPLVRTTGEVWTYECVSPRFPLVLGEEASHRGGAEGVP